MMKKLLVLVLGLVAVAAGVVVYAAATQPESFRVARSVEVAAPPETIFPLINDLRQFARWSPYEKKDPRMERSFSGPTLGKGQRYDWDGNSQVGKGWLLITESAEPKRVGIDLNMVRPLAANNQVAFTLAPKGPTTEVTWSMEGRSSLLSQVVCMFFDMDRMVGGDFETGLASLKELAERIGTPSAAVDG